MGSVLSQDILKAADGSLASTSNGEGGVSSTASVLQGELTSDTPLSRIRRKLAQLETSLPENKPLPEAAMLKVLPSSPNPPPPLEERARGNAVRRPSIRDVKPRGKDADRQNHGRQSLLLPQGRRKSSSTTAPSPPLQQPAGVEERPLQAPSNPCQCPCGRVFSRTDHMRRHRSLNICVAGYDHPGVPKRVSAAAKKTAKAASVPSSSASLTSKRSSSASRQSGTFYRPSQRSMTSPAKSEPADPSLDTPFPSGSTENMDGSLICECGKRFSRKDGRVRHQRMNACKASITSPEGPITVEGSEIPKDELVGKARVEKQAQMKGERGERMALQAEPSVPEAEMAEERAKGEEEALHASRNPKNEQPEGASESFTHACPCGKVYSRNDSLMNHRANNTCVGGIPSVHRGLSMPDASSTGPGLNLRRSGRVSLKRPIVEVDVDEAEILQTHSSAPHRKRGRKNAGPDQPKSGIKHRARKPMVKVPSALDDDELESEDETLIGGVSSSARSPA